MFLKKKKTKVFCIGAGKTGTTSIEKALSDFGFKMGDQIKAELLLDDYAKRNFKAIIEYCKTADAFQDAPFCFQHTYQALDQSFPNSKFILTIRDSDDQWYQSLLNFHKKTVNKENKVPSWDDLNNSTYRYKGYRADVRKNVFGIFEDEDPYNEVKLKQYYNIHNASIKDYFKNKNNLLIINVAKEDSYNKLCKFLNKEPLYEKFPWENKTKNQ